MLMTKQIMLDAIQKCGFVVDCVRRTNDGYGERIRLMNGAIINVFDKGTWNVQGVNVVEVKTKLDSFFLGNTENIADSMRDDSGMPVALDNTDHFCCEDPILFQMRDKHHEFSMGLHTILECLKMAEQENCVPKLPEKWWLDIQIRYY